MFALGTITLCPAQAPCAVGHQERVSLCVLAGLRIGFWLSLDVVAKNQRQLKAVFNWPLHQAGFSV